MRKLALPISVPHCFRIIAHRGASAYAPENTMAAFSLAERMGVREIELDVQLSRDGHLVTCHDRALDRYGHPGRLVAEMTLSELQSLDMGTWFSAEFHHERMPTLGQLLDRFASRFIYHVEIKEPAPGVEEAVLEAISSRDLHTAAVITSFHHEALQTLRDLDSEIPIGWLVREDGLSARNIKLSAEIGCLQICPRAAGLTTEAVRAAHETLDEVRAHHVKSIKDARRVVETGCNGLTINWPDWLADEKEEE